MRWILTLVAFVAGPVAADIVVPTRVISPRMLITEDIVKLRDGAFQGGISELSQVIGMEARVALYPGRAIRFGDVGPPALIERNEVVQLVFNSSGLEIVTEGRAMGRGSIGEVLKVMNLGSRSLVMGVVQPDRSILVR